MPRNTVQILVSASVLCLITACAIAQDSRQAPDSQPVAIRGRLIDGSLISIDGTSFKLVPPLPANLARFENLNVEIRGRKNSPSGAIEFQPTQRPQVLVPAWWSVPFLLLLSCISFIPIINKAFWEHHYRRIAIVLGASTVLLYVSLLGNYGQLRILETLLDYFKFMSLLVSLFVVSGGILIEISGPGSPRVNTLILAAGAVAANLAGTMGASALLIRPFLRLNKDRIRPFHVVFFIFIVSNCGGALTPVGPPLFLGYIYGVPFEWTITHCWPAWMVAVGLLLCIFYILDSTKAPRSSSAAQTRVRVSGGINFACLGVILFAVFLDKILANVSSVFEQIPAGALLMNAAAFTAYKLSNPKNLERNEFSFEPIVEIGFLFIGIFATMVPALDFLAVNAANLHITTPGDFYFASGALSGVLDNAPTYLNFLSAAHGIAGLAFSPENMHAFVTGYGQYLLAVSLGSVFFGACTYIGNGPNFMVKAIADAAGAPTPSFIGYIVNYTLVFLLPIYVLIWYLFF